MTLQSIKDAIVKWWLNVPNPVFHDPFTKVMITQEGTEKVKVLEQLFDNFLRELHQYEGDLAGNRMQVVESQLRSVFFVLKKSISQNHRK